MIHKKEYMDGNKVHEEYYGQFVTDKVKQLVARTFSIPVLLDSKDPHLNDIPLKRWDFLVYYLGSSTDRKLRECGDWLSLGTGVCILKQAAKQLIQKHRDNFNVRSSS